VARHAARALPTAPRLLVSAGWTSSTPRVAAAAATAAVAFGAGASVFSQCDASKSEGSCLASKVLGEQVQMLAFSAEIDKNHDGKLSKEELDTMWEQLDRNKDGVVTFEEWSEYLRTSGMSAEKRAALEALFRKLDGDDSGTISRAEFQDQFQAEYVARYARGAIVAFLTKGRFIAYTSDIGESARPVMPSWFVNACYGLTFLYVGVAVGHHTFEAHEQGASQMMVLRTFTHSTTFELLASVAMPSLIIHQAVHFAQHQAHRLPAGPVARWAPTVVGLACIPFLPYLDPPVEKAIDAAFEYGWPEDGTLTKH